MISVSSDYNDYDDYQCIQIMAVPCTQYTPCKARSGPCPACSTPSDHMGDHSLGCRKTSDRIARHNLLRDVLFEAAASADLGPTKEEKYLLPGTAARPGDITIRRWMNGKDAAIDVTVTGPLCTSNVAEAAAKAGAALEIACKRKVRVTAAACLAEGIVFLPFALETLGGLHQGAVSQVKLLGSALARCKGMDEGEAIGQLFRRISLTLMKANSLMLSSRCQEADFPSPSVDGIL